MPKVVIKNQEPVEPKIEYYLHQGRSSVYLHAVGVDGEVWIVAGLGQDGTMELFDCIDSSSGIKVDSEGRIVIAD